MAVFQSSVTYKKGVDGGIWIIAADPWFMRGLLELDRS